MLVALDLSLRSPGIARWDTKKWSLYFFSQRKHDLNIDTNITTWPKIPSKTSDQARYAHIMHYLTPILETATHVMIENHAFATLSRGGSNFKLHELMGLVKQKLYSLSIPFELVAIASWRKAVLGHGRADKSRCLEYIKEHHQIDLVHIFGTCQNPANDLADAMCLALYHLKESGLKTVEKSAKNLEKDENSPEKSAESPKNLPSP